MRRLGSQRGVALLMVLITLVVLGAMTADFLESNQVYLNTAVHYRDGVQAEYLANSAVNLSRLLLSVQQVPPFDKQLNFPFWEYADLMLEPFGSSPEDFEDEPAPQNTDPGGDTAAAGTEEEAPSKEEVGSLLEDMMGISLSGASGIGLPKGHRFSVKIVDEDSKLNVNLAARPDSRLGDLVLKELMALVSPPAYDSLFSSRDFRKDVTREQVICEIKDFADQDQDACGGVGGEPPYYMDAPYERKNAPYDSLEELHFVYGIGDDFWSTFVEPDPLDPSTRILTVWGSGRLNVNTASAGALLAVLCQLATDDSGVSACSDARALSVLLPLIELYKQDVVFNPVKTVADFIGRFTNPAQNMMFAALLGAPLQGFPITASPRSMKNMLTTKSTVFSIYAQGEVGKVTRRLHVVVDMSPKHKDIVDPSTSMTASGGKVLYWRLE